MTTVFEPILVLFPPLSSWEAFALSVAFSLAAAKIVQVISLTTAELLLSRTDMELDDIIFDEVHTPLYVSVALTGIYLATKSFSIDPRFDFQIQAAILTTLVVIWVRTLKRIGDRFFEHVRESSRWDSDFAPIFENLFTFFVLISGLLALLAVWNIDITPLLASAGIAGVAIGFAAKDAVANFFGGIALYFDNTYKIGDYVELDSGDAGTVIDIGVRSTVLKTRDDILITVPNAMLNSSKVINHSAPQKHKRVRIPIGVAYGTDIEAFEKILKDIANEEDYVLDFPSPKTHFREFGDNSIIYELRAYVSSPMEEVMALNNLNRAIYQKLNEEDITIPFPQRTISYLDDAEGHREEQ